MNVKYYGYVIRRWEIANMIEEWLAVLTTPSAIIFLFWKGEETLSWKIIGVVATALAISRLVFRFSEKIKHYEGCITEYRMLTAEIEKLVIEVKSCSGFTRAVETRTKELLDHRAKIECKDAKHKRNDKLVKRCQDEVNRELPKKQFYIP